MNIDTLLNYKVHIRSAIDDGDLYLRANEGEIDYVKGSKREDETFIIQKVGEDHYAILTHHKTYIRFREASTFRRAKLKYGETTIGEMEKFKFLAQDDNKYFIQSTIGTYVKIGDDDGEVTLTPEGDGAGRKEYFYIEFALPDSGFPLTAYDSLSSMALQSKDKSSFLRGARNNLLDAKATSLGPWELFELLRQDSDEGVHKFAIQNIHFKKYIRARKKNPVIDQSNEIGPWEKYEFIRYDDGVYAIKTAHGTYLGVYGDQVKHYPFKDPNKQLFYLLTEE